MLEEKIFSKCRALSEKEIWECKFKAAAIIGYAPQNYIEKLKQNYINNFIWPIVNALEGYSTKRKNSLENILKTLKETKQKFCENQIAIKIIDEIHDYICAKTGVYEADTEEEDNNSDYGDDIEIKSDTGDRHNDGDESDIENKVKITNANTSKLTRTTSMLDITSAFFPQKRQRLQMEAEDKDNSPAIFKNSKKS